MRLILKTFTAILTLILLTSDSEGKETFLHFTTREGLSHNTTTYVFQDRKGFIWVSTTDGLNRFDGKSFKQFFHEDEDSNSIRYNNLGQVIEDGNGNLYVATGKGVTEYLQSNNSFKNIDLPVEPGGAAMGVLRMFFSSSHHFWIATRFEVFELDSSFHLLKKYNEELSGSDVIYDLFEDKNENVWISRSGSLNKIDTKTGIILNNENNPEHREIFNHVLSTVVIESDGNILGVSENNFLLKFNSSGEIVSRIKLSDNLNLPKMFITKSGKIWINSPSQGLQCFTQGLYNLTKYLHDDADRESINGIVIHNIIEDKDGNTWLTTENGLDMLPHRKCNFNLVTDADRISEKSPGKNFIQHFLPDHDKVWFTIWGKGLYNLDLKTHKKEFYKPDKTGSDNFCWDLIKEKDELWTGNFHGLHILNLSTKQFTNSKNILAYPREMDSAGIIKFFRDRNSCIWISLLGEHGIIKYNIASHSFTHYSQKQRDSLYFPFRHFEGITQDEKGRIWMSYKQSEGLILYDSSAHQFKVETHNGKSIFKNQANDLLAFGNFLWIGSNDGLYKMNLENYALEKYTRSQGLINNNVQALAMDGTGTLWIAMDGGLSLLEPGGKWFTNMTGDDGLPENSVSSMYYDPETKRMYCSNSYSFFYIATDSVEKKHILLSPCVTSFSVMGEERIFNEDSAIMLKYTDRYFSFDLGAPLFPSSEQNHYAYKLDGFDKEWVYVGNKRFAGYTDLSYGSYLFHLKASHDGIHWYEMKKPISIKITAPFYLKKWFAVLSVFILLLIISSIVILYYRIKLRGIMLTQTVRNKIASDLHDDIGSTLSSISFLSEIAKQKAGQQSIDITNYFNQVGESSRDMLQTINDIVWSVNPQNDTFVNLIARMRKFAASLLEAKNIQLEFEASISFENRKLNMVERRNLYLMYKEIINNIVKHAQCCLVTVKLEETKEKNILTITDNGKGFDVLQNYDGNGLKNLRTRSMELKAEFKIDSVIDHGTTFTIVF